MIIWGINQKYLISYPFLVTFQKPKKTYVIIWITNQKYLIITVFETVIVWLLQFYLSACVCVCLCDLLLRLISRLLWVKLWWNLMEMLELKKKKLLPFLHKGQNYVANGKDPYIVHKLWQKRYSGLVCNVFPKIKFNRRLI